MELPTYTADAVRAELARKRRTQAELAAALDMTPTSLGKRLSGKVDFTIPEIVAASVYLGVPISTFIPPDSSAVAS
ncbi:helix-turn-helix domain-containing protein [Nocardioides montaniterrae]